jgi:hypothetical protein
MNDQEQSSYNTGQAPVLYRRYLIDVLVKKTKSSQIPSLSFIFFSCFLFIF